MQGREEHARNQSDLAQLSAAVHDQFFDLDALPTDRGCDELRIVLYEVGRRRRREWKGELIIRRVIDWDADDRAGIGWCDIGEITFDATDGCLVLRSNFPLELNVRVAELDVTLTRTELLD